MYQEGSWLNFSQQKNNPLIWHSTDVSGMIDDKIFDHIVQTVTVVRGFQKGLD